MKVLIVDDNPLNQKYLHFSLRNYYELHTANNGLEAVEKIEKEHFDVIIMDLLMPVMDGAEATICIRNSSRENIKNTPIIFVTTNDYDSERTRCMLSGANEYLIKPVDIGHLMNVIRKVTTK